jgi:hypothetical protein
MDDSEGSVFFLKKKKENRMVEKNGSMESLLKCEQL